MSDTPFDRPRRVIPGGVNSPVRAFGSVGGEPVFVRSGQGAYLTDVDGRRRLDYVQSWGASILGHAAPHIVEAVQAAAAEGTSFGAPTLREVELAEAIVERVPSVDEVRLVNSGTEAGMTAVRLAAEPRVGRSSSSSPVATTATSMHCSSRPGAAWRHSVFPGRPV